MKLSTLAISALALFSEASALPQEEKRYDADNVSLASPLLKRASVCQRDFTEVADVVSNSFTGRAQLAYSIGGGGITFHVCRIINHYTTSTHPCTDYAGAVALTIGVIVQTQMKDGSDTGATTSDKRRRRDDASDASTSDIFVEHLKLGGFSFGQIETTTTVSRRATNDNTTAAAPEVAESFIIRNVVEPSGNITAADFHYTSFTNGTGYLHVIHATTDGGDSNGLEKRHNGAGFKYSWNRFVFNKSATGADINSLAVSIGQKISQDWAYDADYFELDQWIGAIGVDYILLKAMGVAVRIISELDGFGEEYEDVNICGDVSGAVHDELRRSAYI